MKNINDSKNEEEWFAANEKFKYDWYKFVECISVLNVIVFSDLAELFLTLHKSNQI